MIAAICRAVATAACVLLVLEMATPSFGADAPIAPAKSYRSHPPMRPLPVVALRELASGPKRFVDAARGDDAGPGSVAAPWKSLSRALRRLSPGETLYLRGGVYYEKPVVVRSGTEESPITIASYPGEMAVIDGGLREFAESPETSWEPLAGGADGEFVSTRAWPEADARRMPQQFLPGAWEPMWGIEEERPLALGSFADSMVPLHSYRIPVDLRSKNELWVGGKKGMLDVGLYGGPGLWFNRETGRIHVRLAHHALDGLGSRAYRGETDPRKIPLVISAGFGEDVFRISGVRHVRIQDIVFRGAAGSPMIPIYGSEAIELDGLTVYGGFPALLVNASKNVRVVNSAFRGLAAPWTSRAHMKYRGTASYQVVLLNNQPVNENIELAHCEFTDDHDFAFLRHAKNLRFHHNLVDNFNDDGLECGPKLRDHTIHIYQNRLGACLIPITQHELTKDDSPADHDAKSGVFIYRNVIDLRAGTYSTPPEKPDPTGAYLHREGHLASDHGGPVWPFIRFYQNTAVRHTPVFRDYFLFGLGAAGTRRTERDVFNNIFVQTGPAPGLGFAGVTEASDIREGGNVLWGYNPPADAKDPFAKFRASKLFADSRKHYEPGWSTHDRLADPGFMKAPAATDAPCDLRLRRDGGAIDVGLPLPEEWPDPLRAEDAARPDAGALPVGATPWGVGIRGRIPLFGEAAESKPRESR